MFQVFVQHSVLVLLTLVVSCTLAVKKTIDRSHVYSVKVLASRTDITSLKEYCSETLRVVFNDDCDQSASSFTGEVCLNALNICDDRSEIWASIKVSANRTSVFCVTLEHQPVQVNDPKLQSESDHHSLAESAVNHDNQPTENPFGSDLLKRKQEAPASEPKISETGSQCDSINDDGSCQVTDDPIKEAIPNDPPTKTNSMTKGNRIISCERWSKFEMSITIRSDPTSIIISDHVSSDSDSHDGDNGDENDNLAVKKIDEENNDSVILTSEETESIMMNTDDEKTTSMDWINQINEGKEIWDLIKSCMKMEDLVMGFGDSDGGEKEKGETSDDEERESTTLERRGRKNEGLDHRSEKKNDNNGERDEDRKEEDNRRGQDRGNGDDMSSSDIDTNYIPPIIDDGVSLMESSFSLNTQKKGEIERDDRLFDDDYYYINQCKMELVKSQNNKIGLIWINEQLEQEFEQVSMDHQRALMNWIKSDQSLNEIMDEYSEYKYAYQKGQKQINKHRWILTVVISFAILIICSLLFTLSMRHIHQRNHARFQQQLNELLTL